MDSPSHHKLATEIGMKFLHQELEKVGKGKWRVEAFNLGNWLTDVRQTNSPADWANAAEWLKKSFPDWINFLDTKWIDKNLLSLLPLEYGFLVIIKKGILSYLRDHRDDFLKSIDYFANEGQDFFRKIFCTAFFVIGYFHFVYPCPIGSDTRMDFKSYEYIFNKRFMQYLPHEHFDRFPANIFDKGGYSRHAATHTRTPESRGGKSNLKNHIYEYMVDDIEIAAEFLSTIDEQWATSTFGSYSPANPEKFKDGDASIEWNDYLASLGDTIHIIEDFFGHSTYVEHGLAALGKMPKGKGCEIFKRRLKMFLGNKDYSFYTDNCVSTGYFDVFDTLYSIDHIYDLIFGDENESESDKKAEYKIPPGVEKLILNSISLAPDVQEFIRSATEERVKIARRVIEQYIKPYQSGKKPKCPPKIQKLFRLTIETLLQNKEFVDCTSEKTRRGIAKKVVGDLVTGNDPDIAEAVTALFIVVPKSIREGFFDVVVLIARLVPGQTFTYYDILKNISWILKIPDEIMAIIDPFIPHPFAPIKKILKEKISYQFDKWLGRYRIGCHSLIAKDYPADGELNTVFNYAMDCAKALDWYIIKNLCRWSQNPKVEFIDWRALLEYHLCYPTKSSDPKMTPWWVAVNNEGWQGFPGFRTDPILNQNKIEYKPFMLTPNERKDLAIHSNKVLKDALARYESYAKGKKFGPCGIRNG